MCDVLVLPVMRALAAKVRAMRVASSQTHPASTPQPQHTRRPRRAPRRHPPAALTAEHMPCNTCNGWDMQRDNRQRPGQVAEVDADLKLPRGGERGRLLLLLLPAARLQHAHLHVLAQLRKSNAGLERCGEERGAVLLLGRDALELVLLTALLATHAEVAVEAAERQPLAGHLLETGLRWRH